MVEILFMCGNRQRAVLATLDVPSHHSEDTSVDGPKHEVSISLYVIVTIFPYCFQS